MTSSPEVRQEAAVLDAPLEVKELEWVDCTGANEEGEPIFERLDLRAQTGIGNYYISYDHFTAREAPIQLSTPTSSRTGFATEDQAKAAAQVHFEAAIRSALIPAKPAVEVVEALPQNIPELLRKASQTLAVNAKLLDILIMVDARLQMLGHEAGNGTVFHAVVALREMIAKAMDEAP